MIKHWRISLNKSERKDLVRYFVAGLKHRCCGPAVIFRDEEDGSLVESRWLFMERVHRADGPFLMDARQKWFIRTEYTCQLWAIHGISLSEVYNKV